MDTANLINLGIFAATLGAAIVAAFYTAFTYKMLATMKNQYIESTKPKIHIKVQPEHRSTMFYLIIKNIGTGIAKDISFSLDKDFYILSKKRRKKI